VAKPKADRVEIHDGEEWVDITGELADVAIARGRQAEAEVTLTLDNEAGRELVSLADLAAEQAIALLRDLRANGRPVTVDAPVGEARDAVVVDAHYFAGEHRAGAFWFHPPSLDMAARMAGFITVERDGTRWHLA
jgi:hypothetical protein